MVGSQLNTLNQRTFASKLRATFYRLGDDPFTDPDDLWIHYGYHEGSVAWYDWAFSLPDWNPMERRRVVADRYGSPMKTYKDDSWDAEKMLFDGLGQSRCADQDRPTYFTLGPGSTIDARLEATAGFYWDSGYTHSGPPDEYYICDRVIFPRGSATGAPVWDIGHVPLPSWPWPPDYIPSFPPPVFPTNPDPWFNLPDRRGPFKGDGYNHPRFGTGDPVGGAFVGLGRFSRACHIPPEIQPAIPPPGLFGPDALVPWSQFPGYTPPPDFLFPDPHPDPDHNPFAGPMFPDYGPWGRRPGMPPNTTMGLWLPQPEPPLPTGPGSEDIRKMEELRRAIERWKREQREEYMMGASSTGSRNPGSGTGGTTLGGGTGGGSAGGGTSGTVGNLATGNWQYTGPGTGQHRDPNPATGYMHYTLQPGETEAEVQARIDKAQRAYEFHQMGVAVKSPEEKLADAIAAKAAAEEEVRQAYAEANRIIITFGIDVIITLVTGGIGSVGAKVGRIGIQKLGRFIDWPKAAKYLKYLWRSEGGFARIGGFSQHVWKESLGRIKGYRAIRIEVGESGAHIHIKPIHGKSAHLGFSTLEEALEQLPHSLRKRPEVIKKIEKALERLKKG